MTVEVQRLWSKVGGSGLGFKVWGSWFRVCGIKGVRSGVTVCLFNVKVPVVSSGCVCVGMCVGAFLGAPPGKPRILRKARD